ncbi:MAG TPA: hypothetical protein VKB08_14970 [Bradyrhizobium sp.]|nr:hypothetical protein [Bradyrhizobium sp.]
MDAGRGCLPVDERVGGAGRGGVRTGGAAVAAVGGDGARDGSVIV